MMEQPVPPPTPRPVAYMPPSAVFSMPSSSQCYQVGSVSIIAYNIAKYISDTTCTIFDTSYDGNASSTKYV